MTQREINTITKAIAKLNAELAEFGEKTGEGHPTLYEDPFTTFRVANIKLNAKGTRVSYVYDFCDGKGFRLDGEDIYDYEDAREYIKFWNACLRRAKRYWATDTETLDRIQDPESGVEDQDEDEE